jgi:hypothetical protein
LIRVRDEISKEDQPRWLAVVELALFLTRAWADFLFPDKELPHARELMLVLEVIFIWDLKDKPVTESSVSREIGMPRATLARRVDLLIKEGWVVRPESLLFRLRQIRAAPAFVSPPALSGDSDGRATAT